MQFLWQGIPMTRKHDHVFCCGLGYPSIKEALPSARRFLLYIGQRTALTLFQREQQRYGRQQRYGDVAFEVELGTLWGV
jgi:hypothetical protein